MKPRCLLCAFALAIGFPVVVPAEPTIRLSVKFILDASGNLPTNSGGGATDSVALTSAQAVESNIDYANQLLARTGRGYQFVLTEVKEVSGADEFFNVNARSTANKAELEAAATADAAARAKFHWNESAINIYINNSSSGVCSFPNDLAIFIGSSAYNTLILHEVGHYFDLYHTHEGEKYLDADGSTCAAQDATCAQLIGGDKDKIDETLPDHEDWTLSQLTANNPGATTTEINNTWLNIMSYHIPQDRFVPDQLDRWTDTANSAREGVVNGRTVFVDFDTLGVFSTGSSTDPYKKVENGIEAASAGDTVLIRTGNYAGAITISKGVILRASRGNAILGR